MNTAVRTFDSVGLSAPSIALRISPLMRISAFLLAIAIIISALIFVYVQDINRRLLGDAQYAANTEQQLQLQWSQLLIEQTTWSSPARIQQIASKKLNMVNVASGIIVAVKAK